MKKTIIYIICLFFNISCIQIEDWGQTTDKGLEKESSKDIILQHRNSKLPHTLANPKEIKTRASNYDELSPTAIPYKYLGYTYKLGNCLTADPRNIVRPIVNIESLVRDEYMKDYISIIPIRKGNSSIDVYNAFDKAERNTSMTKKVESGFSLNVGLFKIGRKKTVTEVFKTKNINQTESLTGEVNLMYMYSKVWLDNTKNAQKRIATKHISRSFIDNLYNTPISELIREYGPYVLTHFYTGGKALGLYVANKATSSHFELTQKDVEKHLNASYDWKIKKNLVLGDSIGSVSANFGFTYGNGKDSGLDTTNIQIYNQITISGGDPIYNISTNVNRISDNSIDLSPWLNSLRDDKTHIVADIADEGLVGIDKFILEKNFQRRIRDTYMEYLENRDFDEPFIEIVKVFVRTSYKNEKLYDVAAVLNTRQGDKIIFTNASSKTASDEALKENEKEEVFMSKAKSIAEQKSKFYQCEIRTNSKRTIKPYLRMPLSIELNSSFNEEKVYKYKNPETNIWYIYDLKSRTAFSFYDEEYIPLVYGILDWVENIPEKNISMTTLYQLFTIIGL